MSAYFKTDKPNFLIAAASIGWISCSVLAAETIAEFTFGVNVNPATEHPAATVSAMRAGAGIPTDSESLLPSGALASIAIGGLNRGDVGFRKHSESAWSVANGVLSNSSTVNSRVSEGALGLMIDLASYAGSGYDKVQLSFDYTLAEASEALYLHLWGYVDVNSTPDTWTMNLGASNGNAWESSSDAMTAYNLGGPSGAFAGKAGDDGDAAVILTGASGPQSCTVTFDLSSFATAPNRLEDYDYLAIGFTRKIAGTAPAVTISNFALNGLKSRFHSTSNGNVYLGCDETGLNDLSGAIAADDYIAFTVTPDTGYQMDLSSLTFKAGYSNKRTGTKKSLVKSVLSSVDGLTDSALLGQVSTDPDVDLDSSGDTVYQDLTIDLSALSQFQNISSETEFRFYISDDTNYSINHRIDDVVLSGLLELTQMPNGPVFASNPIEGASASAMVGYSGSIAGSASDPDGDPLTYSKDDGPAWLKVSADGTLFGSPLNADLGANSFSVRVSDNDDGFAIATLNILVNDENGNPPPAMAAADRVRLVWLNDPSTTATIAWDQVSGSDAVVKYGTVDQGRAESYYSDSKAVDRSIAYRGMENRFARLDGLIPDTKYYFVLVDDSGVSPRYWFRTAPDTPKPFTFIVGGDSRNNRIPRQKANRLVAKLRPLFVAFTGDMINADVDGEWIEWFDDWEETVSQDGRIYPLLPHRGNHESGGNSTIYNLFDTTPDNYYALTFGGSLMRYYVLNSESGESSQATWMAGDLSSNPGVTHLIAGYHRPMRPHVSAKANGSAEYSAWAQLFYDNRFKLVCESDAHTMKRTLPVRPSTEAGSDEGFIADPANGTVYIGEGCWGAPLRTADDAKAWTLDMGKFNGFDLIHVFPDQLDVFTVKVDVENVVVPLEEGDEFSLPHGLDLWQAVGGTRMVVNQGATERISYAQFQLDMFAPNQPPLGSKAHEDYDGDGLSNFVEFAFYSDPTIATSLSSGVLPGIVIGPSNEKLISFRCRAESTAQFKYHMTQDLESGWTLLEEGVDYTLSADPGSGYDDVQVEFIGDAAGQDHAFYKIEVE